MSIFQTSKASKMAPYHNKYLLLEGIKCGSWSQDFKAEHT